jgi:hypothetical protein
MQEYWVDPLKVAIKRSRRRIALRRSKMRLRQLLRSYLNRENI